MENQNFGPSSFISFVHTRNYFHHLIIVTQTGMNEWGYGSKYDHPVKLKYTLTVDNGTSNTWIM